MNDELETITEKEIDAIFGKYVPEYNSSQKGYMTKIREVLITGGDPLLLGMDLLENMLKRAKDAGIEHIRIGSRASSVSPQLVTDGLVDMLAQYKPLTIIAHYNHPDELTKESLNASDRFLDAGIRVKEHGVLLRGVNDDVETLYRLFSELVSHGIQPYRLMHCMSIGYEQLRTTVREGMSIARELRSMRGSVGHFDYSIVTPLGKIVGVTEEHILDEKTGQALIDEHRDSPQGILPNRIAPEATYLKLAITSRTIKDGSIPKQVWYRDGRSKY
jgi:L-lysine 2,3-aminomutase